MRGPGSGWQSVAAWWIGSLAFGGRRSQAMPFLRMGEAASEFTDIASADQLARGGVTAWRHCPVIAGRAAAPDSPPRVLAPEPLKLSILVVSALAGVHGVSVQAAGGRPLCCGWGWAGAWMARCAMRLIPSRRDLPCRLLGFEGSGGEARRAACLIIPLTTWAAGCGRIRRSVIAAASPPGHVTATPRPRLGDPADLYVAWFLGGPPGTGLPLAWATLPRRARGTPGGGPGTADWCGPR